MYYTPWVPAYYPNYFANPALAYPWAIKRAQTEGNNATGGNTGGNASGGNTGSPSESQIDWNAMLPYLAWGGIGAGLGAASGLGLGALTGGVTDWKNLLKQALLGTIIGGLVGVGGYGVAAAAPQWFKTT